MKIKAELTRKPDSFRVSQCRVEKVVELPDYAFDAFLAAPLRDQPFIAENKELMYERDGIKHCLLVLGEDRSDGVLVESEGAGYARYAGYLAGARDIVNAELERAADFIVRQGVENTTNGSWTVHIDDLEKQLGLTVREGNGLDAMLLDALMQKPEVSYVDLIGECIAAEYHPRFCKHLRREEVSTRFSPERTVELFSNVMTTALQRHSGSKLYAMLHDDFGLTLQEIRDHAYLADSALVGIGALSRQMLENVMYVRDILQMDAPCDTFLASGPESILVPLEYLSKLTESGRRKYAALLDAEVTDVCRSEIGLELSLDGVKPEDLERFYKDFESYQQAEEAMWMRP